MTSLQDLIKQHDVPTKSLAVGDRVLFERADDSGSFSINLGEVKAIKPRGEFKEAEVTVRGIHTFFPDGSHRCHRGLTPWGFPISHFSTSVGERLKQHATQLEKRAQEMRAWVETLAVTEE